MRLQKKVSEVRVHFQFESVKTIEMCKRGVRYCLQCNSSIHWVGKLSQLRPPYTGTVKQGIHFRNVQCPLSNLSYDHAAGLYSMQVTHAANPSPYTSLTACSACYLPPEWGGAQDSTSWVFLPFKLLMLLAARRTSHLPLIQLHRGQHG